MKDFVHYVNNQIACGKYLKNNVVNIDETNIYFDLTGTTILADYGSRTVSVRGAGCSVRCTVLLGVAMDGTKLPPFIILKGREGGRVIREFSTDNFPQDSVYAVQDKA